MKIPDIGRKNSSRTGRRSHGKVPCPCSGIKRVGQVPRHGLEERTRKGRTIIPYPESPGLNLLPTLNTREKACLPYTTGSEPQISIMQQYSFSTVILTEPARSESPGTLREPMG